MKGRYRNFNFIVGSCLVLLIMIPVLIGLFYTPYDPGAMNALLKNMAPSPEHWFGTDNFGRDIFSRVMEGAKLTFLVGLMTVVIGGSIGITIGAITGYFGGPVDEILMRINDGLAAFPSVLLALVMVSIFGSGKYMIILTLGIVFIPSFARVARSEFIAQKGKDYVLNAKLMGAGALRIMFLQILPNTRTILLSAMMIGFNNAVLAEAGLSYLSIGAQPTDYSLGRMLSESQTYLLSAPWYAMAPGLTIVFTVLGFSLMGEGLTSGDKSTGWGHLKKQMRMFLPASNIERLPSKAEQENENILEVRDLVIGFAGENDIKTVVKGISFQVKPGEVLGIVGESGSGKSMTALSLMGLLQKEGKILQGSVRFNGKELTGLAEKEFRAIRGNDIAMIFQEPMTSLNPLLTVGKQVEEQLLLHGVKRNTKERVLSALADAGLEDTEKVYHSFPHQLSGGMRQRVMIAMAMICKPRLLLADEPTTALDVTVQARILHLLKKMNQNYQTSMVFISHDLTVIRKMCSRVLVMYEGSIVEQGSVEDIFNNPQNTYTKKLLCAALGKNVDATEQEIPENEPSVDLQQNNALFVQDLHVFYKNTRNQKSKQKKVFEAVKGVSLQVGKGEIVGIVGESGCGKSTLAKAVAGLTKDISGVIDTNHSQPQMVFQDPYGSLNPAKRVYQLLQEPLKLSKMYTKELREQQINSILNKVGLTEEIKMRYPHELSGGQRQRVAIAMSLMLKQELIILDEPVSALDVTVQEQILDLLLELRVKENLSFLFISHDMYVIRRMCDRVCVMYHGEIVEQDSTKALFEDPKHPYTRQLLDAVLR